MFPFTKISAVVQIDIHHLPIVLIIGLAIFFGTIGARIFQKLRIPQVVGYIIIGLIIGQSFLGIIGNETIEYMRSFNLFALGIIGFMIGGELKYAEFRKHGKQFFAILLAESLFAFIIVAAIISIAATFILGDWKLGLALGLVLGAISSATAPAATVDVLWEYKCRGILTRTVLAIVALDDGFALLLFGFAGSAAGILTGNTSHGLLMSILLPLYEIFGAIAIGLITGAILIFALKFITEEEKVLTFTIASVLLIIGLSLALKTEAILAAMVLGATIVNFLPRRSQSTFELVERFAPPIFVLFFVLVGARLQLKSMPLYVAALAILYLIGRSTGKITGAWFGGLISKAPPTVRKYLGLCLFSQAGVAVGLAMLASHRFEGPLGNAVILVVTTTTFLVQLIGPSCVKVGLTRAGEVGLNVTEDDLINEYKVSDVMDTETVTIPEDTPLMEILNIFSRSDPLHYPVVDRNKHLVGIITISGIKETFAHQQTAEWLLACDVMEPALDKTTKDTPLRQAVDRINRYNLEHLCVVENETDQKLLGVLHYRTINRRISTEVLRRREIADGTL